MKNDYRVIRRARRAAGLCQWVVARALGKTQGWLSVIELGYMRLDEKETARILQVIERLARAVGRRTRAN